jgi:hypothetical protein
MNRKLWTWLVCVGLAVGTALLYAPVRGFQFVNFDDFEYIVNNSQIRHFNWQSLAWCWQTTYASNWHPLTWMSHMLDWQWFGMWAGGHHATSVVFHILNSLLLFAILRRMTGAFWRSAMVAALFAWHPLHVESVAWVAERKDVLSTFFWMLTIWAYVRYVEEVRIQNTGSKSFYALALVFFALGLTAKPMLVTLPFVLLLLDWWPLRRMQTERAVVNERISESVSEESQLTDSLTHTSLAAPANPQSSESRPAVSPRGILRLLIEKAPFLFLSAVSCVVTIYAQRQAGAIQSLETVPLPLRLENSLVAYCQYLGKLIWPQDLSPIYCLTDHLPGWEPVAAGLLLVAVSVIAVRLWRTRPYFLTGWLLFLGTLVPVIGLVQVGSQAFADRYTYMPSIGFFIVLCWGMYDLALALRCRPVVLGVTAWGVLCLCGAVASRQLGFWRNGETLFRHAIAAGPSNYIAHLCLGEAFFMQGRVADATNQYAEALRLKPHYALAHHQWAIALAQEHNTADAVAHYRMALAINPNRPDTLNNLAWTLATDPDAGIRNGADAVRFAAAACKLTQSQNPLMLGTLAAAYAEAGNFSEAIATAHQAHDLAVAQGKTDLAAKNTELLALYNAHKPCHE